MNDDPELCRVLSVIDSLRADGAVELSVCMPESGVSVSARYRAQRGATCYGYVPSTARELTEQEQEELKKRQTAAKDEIRYWSSRG